MRSSASPKSTGIPPGGGATQVAELMSFRDAMYHSLMGENLSGHQAAAHKSAPSFRPKPESPELRQDQHMGDSASAGVTPN
jgi:enoyl-CoA hydratase/carnithine racemase